MKRTVAACLLPLVLGACAGGLERPAPADRAPPVPGGVTGTYRLQSINDQGLPVLSGSWGECREYILSAGLALQPNRRYVLSGTARQDCAGAPPIENRGGGAEGRYTVQGDIVRLDDASTPIDGAAAAGWTESPPGRHLAIGDLGGVGMLDGETLTIRLDDGRIATFRRTQG